MRPSSLNHHEESDTACVIDHHAETARARRDEQRRRTLNASVPLRDAASITGSSEAHLHRLIATGDALAVSADNRLLLPVWQLRRNAVSPVVKGIRRLAGSFPGDAAALHCWATRTNPDLRGVSPAQALQDDRSDIVISLARAIGAAGR